MRILKKGEQVDWQFGGGTEYITDKDFEELKQGKRAEIDVMSEYTIVLKYRKEQDHPEEPKVYCRDCARRNKDCPLQVWCGPQDDDYCSRGVPKE